ncbi:MAG TPA: thioredoxin family protein [Verrucomicrobiae bacterium]|nr:thioredoxin family protein [Verrucomicrobiae bacterium]
MKASVLLIAIVLAGAPARAGEAVQWYTDAKVAAAKAYQEKKFILLDFTGSDWSPWCARLKQEVFDRPEFADFAREHLIAVELDFPRTNTLSAAQQVVNGQLVQVFHIEVFPTVILLDSQGRPLGQIGYQPGGPRAYILELARILHIQAPAEPAPVEPEVPRKPLVFVPDPSSVPTHYGALTLKGISGSKDRRMVLINNATLMAGETAKVKVNDKEVVVFCKEIGEQSVLVTADGKPLELKLGAR